MARTKAQLEDELRMARKREVVLRREIRDAEAVARDGRGKASHSEQEWRKAWRDERERATTAEASLAAALQLMVQLTDD
jgi:hypothetical protein